jgi:hypothetical protein
LIASRAVKAWHSRFAPAPEVYFVLFMVVSGLHTAAACFAVPCSTCDLRLLSSAALQASTEYSAALHELGAAEAALSHMAVGFKLEEATSRRSSAAPPSALLMAGEAADSWLACCDSLAAHCWSWRAAAQHRAVCLLVMVATCLAHSWDAAPALA